MDSGRAGPSRAPRLRLVELEAEARHARERYQLYRAKAYGPRLTSAGRLRELERNRSWRSVGWIGREPTRTPTRDRGRRRTCSETVGAVQLQASARERRSRSAAFRCRSLGDGRRRDRRTRARPRLRRRDERRLSAQAPRRGPRARRAGPAPAAKRRRPLPLEVVRGRLGGGGRRLGASRRRARPRAALDRAGRPLGRAGVPRRLRRALLRLPARTPPVGRRDRHRDRACDHRADLGAGRRRAAGLRGGGVDRDRVRRPRRRRCGRRGRDPPPRPAGGAGPAPRRRRRRALRRLRHRDQVPGRRHRQRGARADQPVDGGGR